MTVNNLKLLLIILLIGQQLTIYAQIGINTDNAVPDPSTMLDVSSTEKGFLTPRMTAAERDAIANPATSLLIYQTDNTPGFYYNSGAPDTPNWVRIGNNDLQAVCDGRIPIDSVARFGNYNGRFCGYVIDQPGSYYLTGNVELSQTSATGIYIDTDNVTLDLNGYTIKGPGVGGTTSSTASDGIYIFSTKYNITIKNGVVEGWRDDAIDGARVNNSLFQNIITANSGDFGLYLGDNNVTIECHAYGNANDGFSGQEGCNFIRCTASENGEDGFEGFSGCQFLNCTAYLNGADGIDGFNNVMVLGCTAYDNNEDGIELTTNCFIYKCNTTNNELSGISAGSSTTVSYCMSYLNKGDGIRIVGAAGVVYSCIAHNNDLAGIHTSGTGTTRTVIEGNGVTDNDVDGIKVAGREDLVIGNRAAGNANDYNLSGDTNFGPIIDVTSAGDISTVTGADHNYANFIY